jgi:hypothetical protein
VYHWRECRFHFIRSVLDWHSSHEKRKMAGIKRNRLCPFGFSVNLHVKVVSHYFKIKKGGHTCPGRKGTIFVGKFVVPCGSTTTNHVDIGTFHIAMGTLR